MGIPDYVSPIVGYRVWHCDNSAIRSLNGSPWPRNQPFMAKCRRSPNSHQAPQMHCRCGIYAAKELDQLQDMGLYLQCLAVCPSHVFGEVYLWGVLVEHTLGWRAQFAYPKNLVVPLEMIPLNANMEWFRSQPWLAYDVDVFLANGTKRIPLWFRESGYQHIGLDYAGNPANRRAQDFADVPISLQSAWLYQNRILTGWSAFAPVLFLLLAELALYFLLYAWVDLVMH